MEVDASLICDDEESEKNDQMDIEMDIDEMEKEWTISSNDPSPQSFDLNGPMTTYMEDAPNVIRDEEDQILEMATAELLHRHHDMGHISFAKLQQMARQ